MAVLGRSQVDCGLRDHFGTTIGDLWDIYGLSVTFYKRVSIIMQQKSSARKGFCAESLRQSVLYEDIDVPTEKF